MFLTRPGLCKQMADGLKGAGPLTPLVAPLGVVAASLVRRPQLAAVHLHCGGLGQNCLDVSVCHWVLLLLGGIKHLRTERWVCRPPFGGRKATPNGGGKRALLEATPGGNCKAPLLILILACTPKELACIPIEICKPPVLASHCF